MIFRKKLLKNNKISSWFVLILSGVILISLSSCKKMNPSLSESPTNIPLANTAITSDESTSCFVTKSLDTNKFMEGSLIYFSPESRKNIILNLETLESKVLGIKNPIFKLNNNLILDLYPQDGNIRVLSKDQDISYEIPTGLYFRNILQDGSILLGVAGTLEKSYNNNGFFDENILLFPTTGKQKSFSLFLPYFYSEEIVSPSFIEYSPDLQYVIYSGNYQGGKYILMNANNGKLIWDGGKTRIGSPPVWKTDSSTVTVIDNNETSLSFNFFNLSVDGSYNQITNLDKIFTTPYVLTYPAWSPDGRYLAFTVDFPNKASEPSEMKYLYIYDSVNKDLLNPCLSLGYTLEGPIWSPDSQYIAVVNWNRSKILIIDLLNKTMYDVYTDSTVNNVYETPNMYGVELFGWIPWVP